ncbi:MAG TPA: ADP-forming succinate--CoA ligase subunit beta, partial [Gammaproteobacteria bacterium]|nr:ADP-forming succinate--CoA ligase subunit beta [Gammaproteobacteria bacterium]
MNLHEFQSKQIFSDYGIPVPEGVTVASREQVPELIQRFGEQGCVVKAQVHAGGRGKAGGVIKADDGAAIEQAVDKLLGDRLVTRQTGPEGLPINRLLVEPLADIRGEYYLGMLIDRAQKRIAIIASDAGGMSIEEVAKQTPERIHTETVDPAAGLQPYQARNLGFGMGLDGGQVRAFTQILFKLYQLFTEKDASLVEINPLALTGDGALLALDAKLNIDDNALYRQQGVAALRDESQEDAREVEARKHDLNYISLDGDIGCMVNGAGLAMATMDLIKLQGGEPANFLDVGGGATAERVAAAFKLILSDDNVKAVLVNIFGGIV